MRNVSKFAVAVFVACSFTAFANGQRSLSPRAVIQHAIPTKLNGIVPGQVLVKYERAHAISIEKLAKIGKPVAAVNAGTFVRRIADTGWTLWKVPASTDTLSLAKQLRSQPGVIYAEPVNRVYPLQLPQPNDPDFTYTETDPNLIFSADGTYTSFRRLWNLDDINAFPGWSIFPGVWYTASTLPYYRPVVAVIDTGCDMVHPDFINAGGTGTDTSQGGQLMTSLSHYWNLGAIDNSAGPDDLNGHGTHVTGIALAAGNNGPFSASVDNGMLGIGYNARAMIEDVFDSSGNAADTDAAAAMYYAADNHADIINLSLGTTNYSQVFQDAVTYAFQKGSAVFAAGNENGNGGGNLGPIYPAACSGACAVEAAGPGGAPATQNYAGTGSYVDLAAPGGDVVTSADLSSYMIQYIWSTAMETEGALYQESQAGTVYPPYGTNYAYLAGTSMACPHVSGAAALYYGQNYLRQIQGYSNVKAYRALEKSAQGLGQAPNGSWDDTFGYGELDVQGLLSNGNPRGATVGSIAGIVYYNGTPVSNASVTAALLGKSFTTTTLADGTYRFDELPPGVCRLTAVAFGATKTKHSVIIAGSDTPGVDFWTGTYTGDSTAPVIPVLSIYGPHTATLMRVDFWAYDTETGIDSIWFKIGTYPGGSNVMGSKEIIPVNNANYIYGNFPLGKTYYITATTTNGAGLSTNKSASVNW